MLKNISRSLSDILGSEYMEAVVTVATEIGGMDKAEAQRLANEKVDFFPESYIKKMDELAEAMKVFVLCVKLVSVEKLLG